MKKDAFQQGEGPFGEYCKNFRELWLTSLPLPFTTFPSPAAAGAAQLRAEFLIESSSLN